MITTKILNRAVLRVILQTDPILIRNLQPRFVDIDELRQVRVINMNSTEVALEVRDRLEIADAVYRFVAGIDFSDEELFISAFAPDAIVDVTSNSQMWGIEFPLFKGRDAIVEVFKNSVFLLDTTHSVTNPRTKINGDRAKLYTVTEAQHLPPNDHSRHCLIKSQYDVSLVRDGDRWVISHLIINCIWFTGETSILIGQ